MDDLYEAINRACGELPESIGISLELEKGSATIRIYDWSDMCYVETPDAADRTLVEQVGDALEAALVHHGSI